MSQFEGIPHRFNSKNIIRRCAHCIFNERPAFPGWIISFNELRHKKTLDRDQVRTDLLVLMHLIGDLHQPLRTAYDDDLGGNRRAVQFDELETNLPRWMRTEYQAKPQIVVSSPDEIIIE